MKKRILTGLFFLFLCFEFYAAEKPDLYAIANAAKTNNPARLKAADELRAAEADAAAEKAQRLLSGNISANVARNDDINDDKTNPVDAVGGELSASTLAPAGAKISVGAKYSLSRQKDLTDTEINSDMTTLNAGVSVPVFLNGRVIDLRLDKAAKASAIEIPLEAARSAAAADERNAADSALRLALEASGADRSLSLALRRADLAEKDAAVARVKYQLGTISFSDLDKTEKALDEAKVSAFEARRLRDKKIRDLCTMTGFSADSLDPAIFIAPVSAIDSAALADCATSPEIAQAIRASRSAEMALVLSGAENAPSLSLSANCSLPGPETKKKNFYSDGEWAASATMTIPLPSGVSSARKKAADARLSAARQNESAVRSNFSDTMNSALDALASAIAREQLQEQILTQTSERSRQVLSSLESQTATTLDAERAQLSVDEAKGALEDDRSARFKAELDLYQLCGLDPLELLKVREEK
jgi:outer membrane protein TolC